MFERHQQVTKADIIADSHANYVELWAEDDSRAHDRERIEAACDRIIGEGWAKANLYKGEDELLHYLDYGDIAYSIHHGGWVTVSSCEGSSLGMIIHKRNVFTSRKLDKNKEVDQLVNSLMQDHKRQLLGFIQHSDQWVEGVVRRLKQLSTEGDKNETSNRLT